MLLADGALDPLADLSAAPLLRWCKEQWLIRQGDALVFSIAETCSSWRRVATHCVARWSSSRVPSTDAVRSGHFLCWNCTKPFEWTNDLGDAVQVCDTPHPLLREKLRASAIRVSQGRLAASAGCHYERAYDCHDYGDHCCGDCHCYCDFPPDYDYYNNDYDYDDY